MVELNPTVREQEIYEEMELTPEMVKSIRTLCADVYKRQMLSWSMAFSSIGLSTSLSFT